MWKKFLSLMLIFNLLYLNCSFVYSFYKEEMNKQELLENELIEVSNNSTNEEPILNCRIAVAYDRKSGNVIWGKEENKKTAMASTTKIMTAILVIENYNLNETITVSRKSSINWWVKIRIENK